MNDKIFYNALAQINLIGPRRFKKLISFFKTAQAAWQADLGLLEKAGLDHKTAEVITTKRRQIEPSQAWEKLVKANIELITPIDQSYPQKLKELYDLPQVLYVKGKFLAEDDFAVAIVGTRRIANYGKQITPQIAQELAQEKITVVSGLALGVDALAHRGALKAACGRTIAVLGGGIDENSIYPSQNRFLAREIIAGRGAIISEFPPGTAPISFNFPQRNRIVSGLALATLVVEAPLKSGALLTAKNALDQNRDVFAVPGSIFNLNSAGPHNLIKMGAKLITSASDILEELNLKKVNEFTASKKIIPDTKEEAEILKYLMHEPIHIDVLTKKTNLAAQTINSTLTLMEMKGKVKNLGGLQYVLAY